MEIQNGNFEERLFARWYLALAIVKPRTREDLCEIRTATSDRIIHRNRGRPRRDTPFLCVVKAQQSYNVGGVVMIGLTGSGSIKPSLWMFRVMSQVLDMAYKVTFFVVAYSF